MNPVRIPQTFRELRKSSRLHFLVLYLAWSISSVTSQKIPQSTRWLKQPSAPRCSWKNSQHSWLCREGALGGSLEIKESCSFIPGIDPSTENRREIQTGRGKKADRGKRTEGKEKQKTAKGKHRRTGNGTPAGVRVNELRTVLQSASLEVPKASVVSWFLNARNISKCSFHVQVARNDNNGST